MTIIIKTVFQCVIAILPSIIKIAVLRRVYGYKIGKKCKIGISWVFPKNLEMADESWIGHFNVIKGLDLLKLGNCSLIGKFNWVTATPATNSQMYLHVINRTPCLLLGNHTGITGRHFIDCTHKIEIGDFATIAGNRSQFYTHSMSFEIPRQDCAPIKIGKYTFVGAGSIILPGSSLPDYSILAAGSVLLHNHSETHTLYAGAPAERKKSLSKDLGYFTRAVGWIW